MPRTNTTASRPQPIAPAPDAGRAPPALRPMPLDGNTTQLGVSSPYGTGPLMQTHHDLYDGIQLTRVVGSQGRRGILPSSPGRPAVPAAGATGLVVPIKDADGKYPCPHCSKSYLHRKHLKRHLLRHTGDRPYMCVLCRDTFCRSDILKRHFQKCSIRRGNPSGVSHLSHPQARVRNHAQGGKAGSLGNEDDLNHLHGLDIMPSHSMAYPFAMVPFSGGMNNKAGNQAYISRSAGYEQDRNDEVPKMRVPQPYGPMF
ncbi:hypothetical protein VFPPC_11788 [Pochonia chlamydosporia 170]|uniref:C2H2-type domain-containing protein n=1 Tax=Pochonia chlamydosporia 170 TaxID=1380566 RepID=A0A179EYE8_METCM|nr:hypothetical protein VFPPC_11788 [Pochonia chlamydosporia 170]OAQ58227.1 hypothetical protein VFPPC_11788 [Pochonia chlamydosporia 170]